MKWAYGLPLLIVAAAQAQTPPARPATGPGAPPALTIDKQEIRAQLSPRNYTTLAAEIGAKINRIAVRPGQSFKAGQVLVSFDCSIQTAQRARAEAELGGAEKTLEGNRRLRELEAVGKVELANSEASVKKARAEMDLAKATLAKCNVIAPFSGRAAEQKAREQQFVQPGQPLLEILDDSTLELEFIVPSKWLVWLKPDYAFKVAIDETGQTYPAHISRIGARVDPVSQSISVAAVIAGNFKELIAGMSGRVLLAPPAGKQ